MILIVCLDDRNGMSFLNRRLSQDAALRAHMLETAGSSRLWMNSYTRRQFGPEAEAICVDEDFLQLAGPGEYCFAETIDVLPALDRVEKLVVYRWNRHYPSDEKFPLETFTAEMTLHSTAEFPGTSHERITQEVYIR